MKEIHLWEFVLAHISKNKPVMLAVVADHRKGSPGKRGFKMAVTENGGWAGSVGGGIMEYGYIKECRKFLKRNTFTNFAETVYHNKKKDVKNSGLICSGSQTNILIKLKKKDSGCVRNIIEAMKKNSQGIMKFDRKSH